MVKDLDKMSFRRALDWRKDFSLVRSRALVVLVAIAIMVVISFCFMCS